MALFELAHENLFVDFSSMADLDSEHNKVLVANLAKNTIIADTVAPLTRFIGRKPFAMSPRVIAPVNVLQKPSNDYASDPCIHFG